MKLPLFTSILLSFSTAFSLNFKNSKVEFVAVGKPAMIKIHGESTSLVGAVVEKEKNFDGQIKLDLRTLNTGIDLRDKHMKEKYLEVEKFPEAILQVKDLAGIELGKDFKKTVTLSLKLHGIEKPVEVELEMKSSGAKENAKYEGTAKFSIKLSDYSVEIPTYLGIKVADSVNLTVQFEAVK
jgi:polyisoprenoid-binding protein YceI